MAIIPNMRIQDNFLFHHTGDAPTIKSSTPHPSSPSSYLRSAARSSPY